MRLLGKWNAAAAASAKRVRCLHGSPTRNGALVSSNHRHSNGSNGNNNGNPNGNHDENEAAAPSAKVLRVVEDIANLTLSEVADMAVLLKKRLRVATVPVMPNVVHPKLWYGKEPSTIVHSSSGGNNIPREQATDELEEISDGDDDVADLDDNVVPKTKWKRKPYTKGALPALEVPKPIETPKRSHHKKKPLNDEVQETPKPMPAKSDVVETPKAKPSHHKKKPAAVAEDVADVTGPPKKKDGTPTPTSPGPPKIPKPKVAEGGSPTTTPGPPKKKPVPKPKVAEGGSPTTTPGQPKKKPGRKPGTPTPTSSVAAKNVVPKQQKDDGGA